MDWINMDFGAPMRTEDTILPTCFSCISNENIIFKRCFTVLFVVLTMMYLDNSLFILMVENGAPINPKSK